MARLTLILLLIVILLGAVGKFFVFEIPIVLGNDMAPTLQAGDRLLAFRLNTTPVRGQLVLFEHPQSQRPLIRRVIGLPGDRVAVKNEVPVVNGTPAKRTLQREIVLTDEVDGHDKELGLELVEETVDGARYPVFKDPHRHSRDAQELTLKEAYFVLSDNRNHGTDSRTFGPVDAHKIKAVITHLLSPGAGSIKDQPPRNGWVPLRNDLH
jgi:signal peptidase I